MKSRHFEGGDEEREKKLLNNKSFFKLKIYSH